MSNPRVLSLKPQLRLEWRGQDGQSETEQPDHSASLGDSITSSTRLWFSVHTGLGFFEKKPIVHCMRSNANVELDAGTKTFASGLLPDLIAALRRSRKGDLVAVISGDPSIGPELEAWCRFTCNSLVDIAVDEGRTRWVLRYGEAPEQVGEDRPVGSRLWLYTNFDCNLTC